MSLFVDEKTQKERYAICKVCENFIKPTAQCTKCGCFMKVKSRIARAECPVGKWPSVENI